MTSSVDDVRNALSANFGIVAHSLLQIACADQKTWDGEEDYLNNLHDTINSSGLPRGVPISTPRSTYHLRIEAQKIHKTVWVDFPSNSTLQPCEIGDILLVAKYRVPQRILSRCVSFIQVKVSEKNRVLDSWKIDRNQLKFYLKWPTIKTCYVGQGPSKNVLLTNVKIHHKHRLFSPYLLLGRRWQPDLYCGPLPWITGTDLVAAALKKRSKISAPLEIPFLHHLIQMLFQTTGERDFVNNRSQNPNVSLLVDTLLNYVQLNDPPEGEGKPFLVILLTVKSSEQRVIG